MPLILGTNSIKGTTAFNVSNSLRFNDGSSDSLSLSVSGTSQSTTGTISFWFKRSTITTDQRVFVNYVDANNYGGIKLQSDDKMEIVIVDGGSVTGKLVTSRFFRDVSAWYHCVVSINSSDGTAGNRMRLYINGIEETSFSTDTNPSSGATMEFFTNGTNRIGEFNSSQYYDGYISEFVMIHGSQLAADQFGEFDSDSPTIWKPKNVSGLSFGSKDYYLEFKQSGTSQNSSGLGADTCGQDNHFAVNNLTAVDQSIDTCTNNFATLNPLVQAGSVTSGATHTFSNGNLTLTGGTNKWIADYGTFALTTGKWFYEIKLTTFGNPSGSPIRVGWGAINDVVKDNEIYFRGFYYDLQGIIRYGSGGTDGGNATGKTAFVQGNIVSIAIDIDNDEITFYKNGSVTNVEDFDYSSLTTNIKRSLGFAIAPHIVMYANDSNAVDYNFGSPPYSESGGNSDGNGYGNFSMAVPSGYFALNTKNLAEYG